MKKINKAALTAAIAAVRELWNFDRLVDSDPDEWAEHRAETNAKCEAVDRHIGEYTLYATNDFLRAILCPYGFNPDATDEDIFRALEVLGWNIE